MKTIKFIYCVVAVLVFCLFTNISAFASGKKLNVALILWRGETIAEKGFKDGLKDLGYEIQYTIIDAAQDKKKLAGTLRDKVQFDKFDYVYSFGTTTTKMVKHVLSDSVPHIFNIVADPVGAQIVKSIDATGGNISGVSNKVPLDLQIKNARNAIGFKRLGVFFNPREKNSEIINKKITAMGNEMNFQVIPLRSPPAGNMLENNLKKVIDKSVDVDAAYFPTDSFLVSKAELIGDQLRKGKVVSIGAIKKYIAKGVMLGTVTDYYTLGKLAAGIVDRHQKGEKLGAIPVQIQKKPILVINKTTADMLNIKIDQAMMKTAIIIE